MCPPCAWQPAATVDVATRMEAFGRYLQPACAGRRSVSRRKAGAGVSSGCPDAALSPQGAAGSRFPFCVVFSEYAAHVLFRLLKRVGSDSLCCRPVTDGLNCLFFSQQRYPMMLTPFSNPLSSTAATLAAVGSGLLDSACAHPLTTTLRHSVADVSNSTVTSFRMFPPDSANPGVMKVNGVVAASLLFVFCAAFYRLRREHTQIENHQEAVPLQEMFAMDDQSDLTLPPQ